MPRFSSMAVHWNFWCRNLRRARNEPTNSEKVTSSFIINCACSSVSRVTRLGAVRPVFRSRQGMGVFSSPLLCPHQLWGPPTPGVKRPECEADHSSPSSAEVENMWSYTSTPPYVCMAWCLVKQREDFTLRDVSLLVLLPPSVVVYYMEAEPLNANHETTGLNQLPSQTYIIHKVTNLWL